jgi:hypothetical protein
VACRDLFVLGLRNSDDEVPIPALPDCSPLFSCDRDDVVVFPCRMPCFPLDIPLFAGALPRSLVPTANAILGTVSIDLFLLLLLLC